MRRVKRVKKQLGEEAQVVVPYSEVKGLGNKDLDGILNFLKGSGRTYFEKFAGGCVKKVSARILAVKPVGDPYIDYYNMGHRRGLLEAHRMYKELRKHVENEIANRAGLTKEKDIDIVK